VEGLVLVELVNDAVNNNALRPLWEKGRIRLVQQGAVAEALVVHVGLAEGVEDRVHVGRRLRRINVRSVVAHSVSARARVPARPRPQLAAVLAQTSGVHRT
jgi:hypothetical protein